ncbi:Arylsulfatase [Aquirufa nivalisilvae]|uniref:Arylsulfatase n=1 Tax=Aquirufa nivalisilvae TaxID=2516557 RepID=A0A2S2DVK3_9BACT|nr:arylsulfatase [Aquirufa nivalisilvae]AWL08827.1 Arylsulfatase [Aquirufa nivalisilvae]
MKTRFIFPILLGLSMVFPSLAQKKNNQKPNIIYILADDLGYGDISIYNPQGDKVATPHIDQLAKEGMRFLDAHSASGVCTPSRYAIMTGQYPFRSKLPVGVLRGYSRSLIEKERVTVASFLKSQGYQTGVVGKWHLGLDWAVKSGFEGNLTQVNYGIQEEMKPENIDFDKDPTGGPAAVGFDYSYILPASLDMPPYCYLENQHLVEKPTAYTDGNKLTSGYTGPFWREGKMAPSFDFYGVMPRFIDKSKEFLVRQKANKPFFLYIPFSGPHTPWVPQNKFKGSSKAGEYGDFVQQVDASVGQLMKTLDSLGLKENTIVIFTSDNGPYWRENFVKEFQHQAAGEWRGMKGDAFEAGHRIPFIVRWPKKVKAKSISNALVSQTSLLATCQQILGQSPSKNDSYGIYPLLTQKNKEIPEQEALVFTTSIGYLVVRQGEWKWVEGLGSGGFTDPRNVKVTNHITGQLFNLKLDPKESENLFEKYPDKVKEMRELLARIKNVE